MDQYSGRYPVFAIFGGRNLLDKVFWQALLRHPNRFRLLPDGSSGSPTLPHSTINKYLFPQQVKIGVRMFRAYTITSGKGGVGKTTLTVNLGISLSLLERETYILDADIGMANMALILGMDEVPVTLHEVLAGKADIEDAIYEGPAGVKVVPSGISLQGFQQADPDKLRDVMHKLVDRCEFLLIDAPSGISKEGVVPLSVADQVILVVNPELASMADALKTKILCEVMGGNVYGAILNRAARNIPNSVPIVSRMSWA
jgi:cell division ATPase MinD